MLAICMAESSRVQQENRVDLRAEVSVSSIGHMGPKVDATTSAHVFQKKAACATATSHLNGGGGRAVDCTPVLVESQEQRHAKK